MPVCNDVVVALRGCGCNVVQVAHMATDTFLFDPFFIANAFICSGLLEGLHTHELWLQVRP